MQNTYNGLALPKDGQPIEYSNGQFTIPDNPIIPFIEGDGTGRDIWKASQRVFNAAVEKAYGGKRALQWVEIFAGEKSYRPFSNWLPDDSVSAARDLNHWLARYPVVRDLRRREGLSPIQQLAPRRLGQRGSRSARLHQGTANYARRRRHPVSQCCPQADPRPLRLRAPREV